MRTVVHYRAALVEQRRNTKLRIGGVLREQRIKSPEGMSRWTLKWLTWLAQTAPLSPAGRLVVDAHLGQLDYAKTSIAKAEEILTQMTCEDPVVRRLMEMKAIGLVTACILRAEIGHFDRFANGKQLSHFTGLSPRNASSGQRQADSGLIKSCNRMLRATLIEAAHRLIRLVPKWQELAGRLRKNGKPVSVTVAAVANRWVRWLWHQMVHPQMPQQEVA